MRMLLFATNAVIDFFSNDLLFNTEFQWIWYVYSEECKLYISISRHWNQRLSDEIEISLNLRNLFLVPIWYSTLRKIGKWFGKKSKWQSVILALRAYTHYLLITIIRHWRPLRILEKSYLILSPCYGKRVFVIYVLRLFRKYKN